ncbi:hypothetical protein, partial [Rhizobacter sp. Root1221]|uniref:hypothetical protein n=1 Tax=Rhizobacter sp. Root1221 TaxID=1736433 RepID=UPI001F22822E
MSTGKADGDTQRLIKLQTQASENSLALAENAVENNKRQAKANCIQAASEMEAKASKNASES